MIFPSGGVPERGLDSFFMATEACGSGTSDLGLPLGFLEYWEFIGEEAVREAIEVGTVHQGAPGPPGVPRWVVTPLGHTLGVLVHKNSPKCFAVFGLRLVLIFCDVKNKKKTTTSTGHYVNRLVPNNDIK